MSFSVKKIVVFSVAWMVCLMTCQGAGFSILEQSVTGMGRSLAGMAAETREPSALYFNPAAGGWHDRPTMAVGTHVLTGNVRFHNTGRTTAQGKKSGDIIGTTLIPNLALVLPFEEQFSFNMTMSATSGTATNYSSKWMGRYNAIDTEIAVIELNPSFSWHPCERLAVGVGVLAQYADLYIKQAVPLAILGGRGDAKVKMEGDTWAYGFNFGIMFKPWEKTTLGLSYRSKMDLNYDDVTAEVKGAGVHVRRGAKTTLKMPPSVNFGIQQGLTDAWRVMLDISWTRWSKMKEMKITLKEPLAGISSLSETMDWHDNWRFALGTEYDLSDRWTLRFGGAFDQRTVTAHHNKVAKLPDSNRYWISCGASYQWTENLRVDFAITHIFFHPSEIRQIDITGEQIHGKFVGYTNLVSLGMKYDF